MPKMIVELDAKEYARVQHCANISNTPIQKYMKSCVMVGTVVTETWLEERKKCAE